MTDSNWVFLGGIVVTPTFFVLYFWARAVSDRKIPAENDHQAIYEERSYYAFSVGIPVRVSVYDGFLVYRAIRPRLVDIDNIAKVSVKPFLGSAQITIYVEDHADGDEITLRFFSDNANELLASINDSK